MRETFTLRQTRCSLGCTQLSADNACLDEVLYARKERDISACQLKFKPIGSSTNINLPHQVMMH